MDFIFIDFENVSLQAIPNHPGVKMVFIFAGEKQNKVSFDIAESMQKLGPKAKLIRVKGSGPNALDFHIAYYIGKYSEIDPKGSFRIVSKDKGFDPLVKHLVAENIDCARVEKIAAKVMTEDDLEGLIAGLGPHIKGMTEKARPKKADKLKAYIKNRFHEEDAVVELVFKGLIAGGVVVMDGGKLQYPIDSGK